LEIYEIFAYAPRYRYINENILTVDKYDDV